ncbi:CAF17-like 4Fe-4S cluster assembly/insertion protein YgfZ [Chitinilyticum aquatile]|uniref:CAF17-like 4Fe-4S cluster assembly/insertion protein YgfZ n=1 Tax=Chitinilyticum aquatile TaxID=362520 RepID=UPI0003F766D3|nr:folate-binding protein YgfZ [Chitinilyticum aquatile]
MDWHAFLDFAGATHDNGRITQLGDAALALQALETGAVAIPLSHLGLIRFSGEDSAAFLQGQLSSDIRELNGSRIQLSSYSTPKGRMLASFLAFRQNDDYLLQVYGNLQAAIQKRLGMFILRSKTKATDGGADLACIALAGPQARSLLAGMYANTTLSGDFTQSNTHDGIVILSQQGDVFQLCLPRTLLASVWQALLQAGACAGSTAIWELSQIRSGTPWISLPTQEEFVPQMSNLELIGGVSFNKGCYPGQEIVARTQYLGKTKRRMFRMQASCSSIQAGQHVYSKSLADQSAGTIMLAAPSGHGEWEALVVARIDHLEEGLHLGAVDGPALQLLPLPYAPE